MPSYVQMGAQTLTVGVVAVGFTLPAAAGVANTHRGIIYVGGQPIRYRADGTDPTSTSGMFVPAGAYIKCLRPTVDYYGWFRQVKFIRDITAGGDATLEIEFDGA